MGWLMLVLLREIMGELDGEFEDVANAKSSVEGAGRK
jgi:hypothetical protein